MADKDEIEFFNRTEEVSLFAVLRGLNFVWHTPHTGTASRRAEGLFASHLIEYTAAAWALDDV